MPIDIILDSAGEPKHRDSADGFFDVDLFHFIENSAWDGLPGLTAEADVALLAERNTRRVRDL